MQATWQEAAVDWPMYPQGWEPQSAAESLVLYLSGIYFIAICAAMIMWLWSRQHLPAQAASTEWGKQLHGDLRARVRHYRNLTWLTLVPVVLLLIPALLTIHVVTTAAIVVILSGIIVIVGREALRFFFSS